ncbi:MAG: hypothetical protein EXQ56_00720 [Acidobacteria bacterium]|nr:hypothetical protein [Acidobacteriota bacterium]
MEAGIFPARYLKKIFLAGLAGSLLGLVLATPASAQTAGPLQRIGTSSFDEIFEVAADATGVYVAGRTSGLLGQTSSGGIDAFVQKYGPGGSGAPLWTDQLGAGFAYGVATDGTSVYVTGAADAIFPGGVGVGGRDIFLRKYDLNLVPIWTRQFGTTMADYSTAVALDGAGWIYIAGTTQGTLPGQTAAGGGDAFVSKFDANGDLLWTRQFGSPGMDQPVCVAANSTFVHVCGSVRGTLPGQPQAFLGVDDAFVRQYAANGDAGWTKQTGTAGGDIAAAVAVDGTDVYVVGNENIGLVRKYDSGGNQLWTQSFTISETLSAAVADAAGVYVAGSTFATLPGQTRAGLSDPFVRRYSGSGSVIWTLQFGSTNDDLTAGMASNSTGLYVAGRSGSPTGDFD